MVQVHIGGGRPLKYRLSAHSLSNTLKTIYRKKFLRALCWTLLLLVCFATTVYLLVVAIVQHSLRETTFQVEIVDDPFEFPGVTVCRKDPFRMSDIFRDPDAVALLTAAFHVHANLSEIGGNAKALKRRKRWALPYNVSPQPNPYTNECCVFKDIPPTGTYIQAESECASIPGNLSQYPLDPGKIAGYAEWLGDHCTKSNGFYWLRYTGSFAGGHVDYYIEPTANILDLQSLKDNGLFINPIPQPQSQYLGISIYLDPFAPESGRAEMRDLPRNILCMVPVDGVMCLAIAATTTTTTTTSTTTTPTTTSTTTAPTTTSATTTPTTTSTTTTPTTTSTTTTPTTTSTTTTPTTTSTTTIPTTTSTTTTPTTTSITTTSTTTSTTTTTTTTHAIPTAATSSTTSASEAGSYDCTLGPCVLTSDVAKMRSIIAEMSEQRAPSQVSLLTTTEVLLNYAVWNATQPSSIKWCHFLGITDCDYLLKENKLDSSAGNCSTFNHYSLREFVAKAEGRGERYGLSVYAIIDQSDANILAQSGGMIVFIHEPQAAFVSDSKSYQTSPGFEWTFYITPRRRKLLGSRNCAERANSDYFGGKYTEEVCDRSHQQRCTIEICGCANPSYPTRDGVEYCGVSKAVCSERAAVGCSQELAKECPQSCDSTEYDIHVTQSDWPAGHWGVTGCGNYSRGSLERTACQSAFKRKHEKLVFVVPHMRRVVLNEAAVYPLSRLLSDVGSIFSVLFGMSVLSIFELLIIPCFHGSYISGEDIRHSQSSPMLNSSSEKTAGQENAQSPGSMVSNHQSQAGLNAGQQLKFRRMISLHVFERAQ